MSLALTDSQVNHILLVSRPLQPQERVGFMAQLLEELLNRRDELGEGSLARLLRNLQRAHFRPPTETEDTRQGARERAFERRSGIREATCPSAG